MIPCARRSTIYSAASRLRLRSKSPRRGPFNDRFCGNFFLLDCRPHGFAPRVPGLLATSAVPTRLSPSQFRPAHETVALTVSPHGIVAPRHSGYSTVPPSQDSLLCNDSVPACPLRRTVSSSMAVCLLFNDSLPACPFAEQSLFF